MQSLVIHFALMTVDLIGRHSQRHIGCWCWCHWMSPLRVIMHMELCTVFRACENTWSIYRFICMLLILVLLNSSWERRPSWHGFNFWYVITGAIWIPTGQIYKDWKWVFPLYLLPPWSNRYTKTPSKLYKAIVINREATRYGLNYSIKPCWFSSI